MVDRGTCRRIGGPVGAAAMLLAGCSGGRPADAAPVRRCASDQVCYDGRRTFVVRAARFYEWEGHSTEKLLGQYFTFTSGRRTFPRITCVDSDVCDPTWIAFMRCGDYVVPRDRATWPRFRIEGLDPSALHRLCVRPIPIGDF